MIGKIQQQMYTRERGGIFHATAGYDTIAISEGLPPAFVKKYLHPFCMYHGPTSLTERGEKDPSLYPPAVTLFQPETDDLVIGQTVFVPADFTGQRSTYFMHNYIIPALRKDEWVKQPENLFQLNEFQTSYDVELGKVLPDREEVGYDAGDTLANKNKLLELLGISKGNFKQLLFAVMSSIAGKKKVFISLNVPIKEYTTYALKLLELLFFYLPIAHRRHFGAITFTSKPELMNYIHVMFFEPGTLNIRDRSIEKQFIFDFAAGRISGVDIASGQHEYLEYALHQFTESHRIDDFFEFAEMAQLGLSESEQLELSNYCQLTAIYLTINNSDAPSYTKRKIDFFHCLLKFLLVKSDEKTDLMEQCLKILREEKFAADKASALDYIHAIVSINAIVRPGEMLSFILETLKYYQNDPLFHKLWKVLEQDPLTIETLVIFLNEHPVDEFLLELYLEERFKPFGLVWEILNECKVMLGTPYLLGVEQFKLSVRKKIVTAICSEINPFKGVLEVIEFTIPSHSPEFTAFKQDLLEHARHASLRSIHFENIKITDIKLFGVIFPKELDVKDMKDLVTQKNYLIINALYQLITYPSQADTYNLKSLTSDARARLSEVLKGILRENLFPKQFPLLFLSFETGDHGIDYQGLLDYLVRYSDDQTTFLFIKENANLVESDLLYKQSLRTYLINNPKSIWKNRMLRKELQRIKSQQFKHVLKEVEIETANPLIKFLKRND